MASAPNDAPERHDRITPREGLDPRLTGISAPLVEACADLGAKVVVGTRRHLGDTSVSSLLGPAHITIDLETPDFFDSADLIAYCVANLQLAGAERPDNPYETSRAATHALAAAIAERADGNFLIAGLVSRSHGLHDRDPAPPEAIERDPTVAIALEDYVQRISPTEGVDARQALTALAFAEAPGFTSELWSVAIGALDGVVVSRPALTAFARSSAANFLVEDTARDNPRVRLFHQALNDALLAARARQHPRSDDEHQLVKRLLVAGRRGGWGRADDYLLGVLPNHAARGGPNAVDELLADEQYLLHADLRRLGRIAGHDTGRYRHTARLVGLASSANAVRGGRRAAQLSMIDAVRAVRTGIDWFAIAPDIPYHVAACKIRPQWDLAVHGSHADGVRAVCAFQLEGRPVIASASFDGTVRVWDPRRADVDVAVHMSHAGGVRAVCAFQLEGRPVVASAGVDGTVRVWDPRRADVDVAVHASHAGGVRAVCAFQLEGRPVVASAGVDGTVRVWDPRRADVDVAVHASHTGDVCGVCAFELDGRPVVASAGADKSVRVWDPRRADVDVAVHTSHADVVREVCALELDGRPVVASAGADGTVRLWDPLRAEVELALHTSHIIAVSAVCVFQLDGRPVVASGGADGTVRVWDPQRADVDITVHTSHTGDVHGVCAFQLDGRPVVASTDGRGPLHVWIADPHHMVCEIPMYAIPTSLADASGLVVCGLDAGVILLDLRRLAL